MFEIPPQHVWRIFKPLQIEKKSLNSGLRNQNAASIVWGILKALR